MKLILIKTMLHECLICNTKQDCGGTCGHGILYYYYFVASLGCVRKQAAYLD